jgi:hypothetical protein
MGDNERDDAITPAMLEAGIKAYLMWDREDRPEWIVHDIWAAMEAVRPKATETSTSPSKCDHT